MEENNIVLEQKLSDKEKYEQLSKVVESLIDKNDNLISNLANFSALLKQNFNKISWVGFYIYDGNKLYLGPFQGKVACTQIAIGSGVCGTSAEKKETIIVPDVDKFPGHIACDAGSKSEIVIPILKKDNSLFGVLDLDSESYNSFNEEDKFYLEQYCSFISKEIL
ncbi:MAG: GAF domain-containing protein [Syntrophothermus sp.]